jgi:cystathionine gamma-lyase
VTQRRAGDSTRTAHAGLPERADGEPFLPGPTFAAPYHLAGPPDAARFDYGRYDNPTWARLEEALGELEGAHSVVFAAGMAAVSAVVIRLLHTGDVLVAPSDAYPGIRAIATDVLEPNGVEVRLVPTDDDAVRAALPGATLVWLESPSNPGLHVLDLPALIAEAHAGGALVAVDNTVAGPLRQRPLELGADYSVTSASKHLSGHSDLILGAVAVADEARAAALREWRIATGSIPGPFEAWLAHRSLATLGLRLERQEANARALADALRARDDVSDVRWPGVGSLVCFDVGSQARAEAFLGGCALVAEATSFGGLHSTAERRARWGSDDVTEGYIRFNAGIEDAPDLVADVERALELSRP